MVEAKLGFLQMQLEFVVANAMKLRQPVLGIAPERLNAIDVVGASSEFMVAVIDPKVLLQTEIDQAVIARPAIGVNDAVGIDLAADDGLQRGLASIRHDLGIDVIASFEQAKDDGFAASAAPALAANAASTEVGLIGFKLAVERRLGGAIMGQTSADVLVDVVDAAH